MKPLCALGVLWLFAGVVFADDAAAKKMLKELEGSYTPVAVTRAGEPAPDDFLKSTSFKIKGDSLTVTFKRGDKVDEKPATIVLDPTQKPIAIDLTPKEGPEANKPVLGILKVEKDSVTLCWGDRKENAERPKDFSSTKENKQFLIVMKKAK